MYLEDRSQAYLDQEARRFITSSSLKSDIPFSNSADENDADTTLLTV